MNIKNIIKIVVTGGALAAALTGCCMFDNGKDCCCKRCDKSYACCCKDGGEKDCHGKKTHGVNTSMNIGVGTDGVSVGGAANVGSHGVSGSAGGSMNRKEASHEHYDMDRPRHHRRRHRVGLPELDVRARHRPSRHHDLTLHPSTHKHAIRRLGISFSAFDFISAHRQSTRRTLFSAP